MISLIVELQELEEEQFKGRTDILEVVISGVTKIPPCCFEGCANLRKVTIEGNCPVIDYGAFKGCSALEEVLLKEDCSTTSVNASTSDLPSSNATGQTETHGIAIGFAAFEGCANLRHIDLLEKATRIDTRAFKGCISLSNMRLGSALDRLSKSAFLGCDLTRLSINNNPKYSLENGFLLEKRDPDYYSNKTEYRALYYTGTKSVLKLPRSTTILSDLCFSGGNVSELSLPPALLSFDDIDPPGDIFTFTEVYPDDEDFGLASLPDSGSDECYNPFGNSCKLERFRLQKGNSAFSVVKGILYSKDKKVLVRVPPAWPGSAHDGNRPQTLDGYTYAIPEGTRAIDNYAFSGCTTITDVVLPSSLENIGYAAFSNSTITRITVAPGNQTFHSEGALLYKINSFDYPEQPMRILAFCNRDAENTDVNIAPDSVAVFPCAFEGCNRLSKIELPNSISFIGESAVRVGRV